MIKIKQNKQKANPHPTRPWPRWPSGLASFGPPHPAHSSHQTPSPPCSSALGHCRRHPCRTGDAPTRIRAPRSPPGLVSPIPLLRRYFPSPSLPHRSLARVQIHLAVRPHHHGRPHPRTHLAPRCPCCHDRFFNEIIIERPTPFTDQRGRIPTH